jgi:hypothetical protein
MNVQTQFGMRLIGRGALMVAGLALLTSCAMPGAYGTTEATICRELRADLPTYSRADTPDTLASGARFVAVFQAVCKAP